jgi:hypothetical protein
MHLEHEEKILALQAEIKNLKKAKKDGGKPFTKKTYEKKPYNKKKPKNQVGSSKSLKKTNYVNQRFGMINCGTSAVQRLEGNVMVNTIGTNQPIVRAKLTSFSAKW